MANKVTFSVVGEPVAKARPRFNRVTGRTYTPAKTAEAEERIVSSFYSCIDEYEGTWFEFPLQKSSPIELIVSFTFAPPQSWSKGKKYKAITQQIRKTTKPDVDNLLKTVMDALNGEAWHDDSQVVKVTASKEYGESPMTVITIKDAVPCSNIEQYREISDCSWR